MKTRTIGTLALLVIILGIVYYFDYRRETEREGAELKESRLMRFAAQEVDALKIQNQSGTYQMEKRPDGWWLTSPVVDRADQALINESILPELEKAQKANPFVYSRSKETAGKGQRPTETYGLAKPSLELTAHNTKGESVRLTFGSETPVAGESYVVDESQPDLIYATASKIRQSLSRDLSGLRDKTVLEFEPGRVSDLWVKRTSDTLATKRVANGDWQMSEAPPTSGSLPRMADKIVIDSLLRRLQGARASGFVTTTSLQPALYGLDQPRLTVEMRGEKPTTATAALQAIGPLFIGNRVEKSPEDKPLYYAMRRGRDMVFTVSGQIVDALSNPIYEFSDRRIFSLAADQVSYVQIEALTSALAFARDPKGTWHLVTDYALPIDQERVNTYVAYCLGLRAEEYPDPPIADPSQVRLDKPTLRITLASGDRKIRQGFEVGAAPKGKPFFFARRTSAAVLPGEPSVFLIGLPLEGFYSLMRTANYFSVRKLMAFDPATVHKVTMTVKNQDKESTFSLTREKGSWKAAVDDRSATVPDNQATLLLSTLASLEYKTPVSEVNDAFLKATGLNPPPFSIRIFDNTDRQLGGVSFAGTKKEEIVVVDGLGRYFVMETKLLAGAAQTIEEIATRVK